MSHDTTTTHDNTTNKNFRPTDQQEEKESWDLHYIAAPIWVAWPKISGMREVSHHTRQIHINTTTQQAQQAQQAGDSNGESPNEIIDL